MISLTLFNRPGSAGPDVRTVWLFRERLKEHDLVECLFDRLLQQINDAGFIARKRQIVDASFVTAPRQRNSREQNDALRKDETPKAWQDRPDAFLRQKDAVNDYGYKDHVSVDNKNKLIRRYQITSASVHDSRVFDDLLDPQNTNANVWADSAYRSAEQEASLKEDGYRSHINQKGQRKKPLSTAAKATNRRRSTVRSRVEHVSGALEAMGGMVVRTIGRARAEVRTGLMNVAYNVKRFACLQERQA